MTPGPSGVLLARESQLEQALLDLEQRDEGHGRELARLRRQLLGCVTACAPCGLDLHNQDSQRFCLTPPSQESA